MPKSALRSVIIVALLCSWLTTHILLAEAVDEHPPLAANAMNLRVMLFVNVQPLSYKDDQAALASSATNDTLLEFPHYQGFIPDLLRLIQKIALKQDNVSLTFEFDEIDPTGWEGATYDKMMESIYDNCNTTDNKLPLEACHQYHVLAGDFYAWPERAMRTQLSPPFAITGASTVKNIQRQKQDITTLEEATVLQDPVCLLNSSYFDAVTLKRHPDLKVQLCSSHEECVQYLKSEECCLFVDDKLQLQYRTKLDPQLEVTRETFQEQLVVLPMDKVIMPAVHRDLFVAWMIYARTGSWWEDLNNKYFNINFCPIGKAGSQCEKTCSPSHGSSDRFGVCRCASSRWTGEDCSTEVQVNYNWLPPGLLWVCLSMVVVSFLLCAVCAIWLYFQRHRAQVKVAQPYFLLLILLGCLVSTSTIIAMAQQDGSDGGQPSKSDVSACMVIPWLYSLGFCITFGTLFAKIRRIYSILSSATQMKGLIVTMEETLLIVGAVLLLDVAILCVWSIVDPLTWTRRTIYADKFGFVLESEGFCQSEHWVIFTSLIGVYHFLLIAVASYMCYIARHLPERLSNGKTAVIAMISNLQIALVALPVLIILGADTEASFFVRSTAIWMNDFVVVCLIFGDLLFQVQRWGKYRVHHEVGGNERSSGELIADEIQNYVQTVRIRNTLEADVISVDSTTRLRAGRAAAADNQVTPAASRAFSHASGGINDSKSLKSASLQMSRISGARSTNLFSVPEASCELAPFDDIVVESERDMDVCC